MCRWTMNPVRNLWYIFPKSDVLLHFMSSPCFQLCEDTRMFWSDSSGKRKKKGPEPVWASISDVDWEWCPLNKHMQSVYTWQNVTVACRLSVALAPAVFLSQQQRGKHFKNKSNLLKTATLQIGFSTCSKSWLMNVCKGFLRSRGPRCEIVQRRLPFGNHYPEF